MSVEHLMLTGGPANGEIVSIPEHQAGWAIPKGNGSGAPEKLQGCVFYRSGRRDRHMGLSLLEFKERMK